MKHLCKNLIEWWSNLVETFGLRTLILIIIVYATEGFKSFSSLGINYFLKDTMGLEPAVAQVTSSTIHIPWDLKPIYGLISDSLPILGKRRKPYLILVGILGSVCWVALSKMSAKNSLGIVVALFFMTNFSTAFSDVVVDAIVVNEARKEPVNGSGDLQSLSWMASSALGLIGAIFSGMAVATIHPSGVFLISAIGPLVLLPVATLINEPRISNSENCVRHCCVPQIRSLFFAISSPKVWKPALWIFISTAIVPGYGTIFFYFQTNPLEGTSYTNCTNMTSNSNFALNAKYNLSLSYNNETYPFQDCKIYHHNNGGLAFDEGFLSTLMVIGYVCLFFGTFIYNWKLKGMKLRKILFWTQVTLTILSFGDVILATRLNKIIKLPDKVFVVGTEVAGDVISRLQTMPILVLCAKICPEGVEASLFSLLMSINNGSYDVSAYFGAFLMTKLGISRTDFGQLWLITIISSVMSIVPIFFLFLIPDENYSMKAMDIEHMRLVNLEMSDDENSSTDDTDNDEHQ